MPTPKNYTAVYDTETINFLAFTDADAILEAQQRPMQLEQVIAGDNVIWEQLTML